MNSQQKTNSKVCKCGCGKETKNGKEFIKGHSIIYFNNTHNRSGENNPAKRPEVREKIRQYQLTHTNSSKKPEVREKIKQSIIKLCKTKEHINNIINGTKKAMQRPDVKEKLKNRIYHKKPDALKNHETCINCGKIFISPKSSHRLFCSRSCAATGKHNVNYGNKFKILNALNKNYDFQIKRHQGIKSKPTKPEIKLTEWLKPLGFTYVGDGKIIINYRNPDFINQEHKLIIELFGDYWHKKEEEQKRKEIFSKTGYQTLIIWEHELKDKQALMQKVECWLKSNQ